MITALIHKFRPECSNKDFFLIKKHEKSKRTTVKRSEYKMGIFAKKKFCN